MTARQADTKRSSAALALDQLIRVIPFWSIEAWLYQNTDVAEAACRELATRRGRHVPLIQSWRADRTALDEIHKPKDTLCFGPTQNLALSGAGFPAAELEAAKRSFNATMERIRGCAPLLAALQATAGLSSSD